MPANLYLAPLITLFKLEHLSNISFFQIPGFSDPFGLDVDNEDDESAVLSNGDTAVLPEYGNCYEDIDGAVNMSTAFCPEYRSLFLLFITWLCLTSRR